MALLEASNFTMIGCLYKMLDLIIFGHTPEPPSPIVGCQAQSGEVLRAGPGWVRAATAPAQPWREVLQILCLPLQRLSPLRSKS